jgi:hypothetical protein
MVPTFTVVRSTGEASGYTPAASPRLRRRQFTVASQSKLRRPDLEFPAPQFRRVRAANQPTSTGLELADRQEASDTGFLRIPSRLAHRARLIRRC